MHFLEYIETTLVILLHTPLEKVIIRFFSFNLELICTSEFSIRLKFHAPLRRVQFQLFEKLSANQFQIEREKPHD